MTTATKSRLINLNDSKGSMINPYLYNGVGVCYADGVQLITWHKNGTMTKTRYDDALLAEADKESIAAYWGAK